ncbi:hypothetical protein [Agreia pratensis]|uniref:hypothetical protein n=1 Tax=Agreia pratensis TaxID=150121 RepID=UPI000A1CB71E|nr:hypothetical protein [Agreia pratensis]
MRVVGGMVLWVVATLSGVLAAASFSLAGLGWSGGFVERRYWEEGEGQIGVAFGVAALLTWLVLLGLSVGVFRRGALRQSGSARATAVGLAALSVTVVVGLCVLAIGWPEPASEIPSPPWNRA